MTQFEEMVAKAEAGRLHLPDVTYEGNPVSFTKYQLITHIFVLKLMARGMRYRGVTFTQLKKFYGLKGRSAKDCVPELEEIKERFLNLPIQN